MEETEEKNTKTRNGETQQHRTVTHEGWNEEEQGSRLGNVRANIGNRGKNLVRNFDMEILKSEMIKQQSETRGDSWEEADNGRGIEEDTNWDKRTEETRQVIRNKELKDDEGEGDEEKWERTRNCVENMREEVEEDQYEKGTEGKSTLEGREEIKGRLKEVRKGIIKGNEGKFVIYSSHARKKRLKKSESLIEDQRFSSRVSHSYSL